MVAGADTLPMVLPRLRAQIGGHLILGYNIGFDLAVLEAEAERHGVEWSWSAALCLRQLATCLFGNETMMMLGDLEALAAHCQVPVIDRHTALGDAAITLAVYRQLLPALAGAGIVTLGDAWREVARLDALRQANVGAGWVDVAAAHAAPQDHAPLARIDPYPYQHRIRDLMLGAPLIMPADATLGEAAAAMNERSADCVFVGDGPGAIVGIVSERDIVRQVRIPVTDSTRVREMSLSSIMSSPVITVGADDFMHVALGRMSRFDIRHLAVIDPVGHLVGWVSSRELVRQRVTSALVIGDRLATAETAADLTAGLRMLPTLAASLSDENVPGQDVAAVISGQYRAALSEATRLAEARMDEAGRGAAPVEFTMLMLGSAARGESLLAADQDHAILFADGGDASADKAWFMELGGHVADILDAAGIPYCTGGVMSRNDEWCRSLGEWRQAIGRLGQARPSTRSSEYRHLFRFRAGLWQRCAGRAASDGALRACNPAQRFPEASGAQRRRTCRRTDVSRQAADREWPLQHEAPSQSATCRDASCPRHFTRHHRVRARNARRRWRRVTTFRRRLAGLVRMWRWCSVLSCASRSPTWPLAASREARSI